MVEVGDDTLELSGGSASDSLDRFNEDFDLWSQSLLDASGDFGARVAVET